MDEPRQKWHLRFTVTSRCNYRCAYCNPNGTSNINDMSKQEITNILQASYNNGITRVHWTGGEPTVRSDFAELVKSATDIGFQNQIITTNGWSLERDLDKLIKNGLTRVIVSLDTFTMTQLPIKISNQHILNGIEKAVKGLEAPTKISCVITKSTLSEVKDFVAYAHQINNKGYKGRLILKFNQIFPSNPAQLTPSGQKYWLKEFADVEDIYSVLNKIGQLIPLNKGSIEGDNPTYKYYRFENYNVTIGLLALFSWGYPCGGCYKLRVTPSGQLSICIQTKDTESTVGKSLEEITETIRALLNYREKSLDEVLPIRHHFTPQLGVFRFGNVHKPIQMEYFYKILEEQKT